MTQLSDYFRYTRNEIRGIIVMLLMIIVIIGIYLSNTVYYKPPDKEPKTVSLDDYLATYIESPDKKGVVVKRESIRKFVKQPRKKKDTFSRIPKKKIEKPKRLKPFDPNTANQDQLEALGLKPWVVHNILKYRIKGGRFKKPDDLKKIYGLDSTLFHRLKDYIHIPPSETEKKEKTSLSTVALVDVNGATSSDLMAIRGLGQVLSSRILKFRNGLGGFHSIDQVGETFGLPDSTFQKIKDHLILITPYDKILINTADKDQLTRHSYISRKQAELILIYRNEHGNFESIADIQKMRFLSKKKINQIMPYLDFYSGVELEE